MKNDIENEARVLVKLSQGRHQNIIDVIKHGWLQNTGYYFIDMELCQKTLAHHIQLQKQNSSLPVHFYVGGWHRHFLRAIVEILLSISLDILLGLKEIHNLKEVHRDLKPQNGAFFPRFRNNISAFL
jgi:serine/threonine protein kinase